MPQQTLADVFKSFQKLKVLVVGDVMLDAYIYGDVDRISPEAPVPILNVTSRDQRLGGAANVALNIQSLGATPILCSIIGNDLSGNEFLDLMKFKCFLIVFKSFLIPGPVCILEGLFFSIFSMVSLIKGKKISNGILFSEQIS